MRRLDVSGAQPVAHGLLHRGPAVRERRLHRRLAPAVRDQRLAAAVAHPQQRGRPAGRTASGTRSSRASRALRMTRPSRTRRTRRSTRRRSAARSRTSSSTTTDATTCACPRRRPTPAASPGPTARRRVAASRSPTSTSRSPATRSSTINTALAQRQAPDPHARASTTSTARSTSSAPTRSCSAWATRRSPPSAVRCRWRSKDAPGIVVAGVTIDAGTVAVARAAAGRQARQRPGKKLDPANPITLSRRVLPRRRPAHRQGRHRARGQQPTTCSSTTPGCGAATTASRASRTA